MAKNIELCLVFFSKCDKMSLLLKQKGKNLNV